MTDRLAHNIVGIVHAIFHLLKLCAIAFALVHSHSNAANLLVRSVFFGRLGVHTRIFCMSIIYTSKI